MPRTAHGTQRPTQKPPTKPAPPAANGPPRSPDAVSLKPSGEGAISLALLDAGTGARVAYTAEKPLR